MSDSLRDIQGNVKWFDPKKGFGFIVGPEGQDVFVHYTQIEGAGFRVLDDGEQVIYDAVHTPGRGWNATAVRRVDPKSVTIHVKKATPASSDASASTPADSARRD